MRIPVRFSTHRLPLSTHKWRIGLQLLLVSAWSIFLLILLIVEIGCTSERTDPQHQLIQHYHLQTPEGDGPFPAVMLILGCSGFRSSLGQQAHFTRMARQLRALGYAVVYVDYLAARELTYCHPLVGLPDIARDVLHTVSYLQSRPEVRAESIFAMGWSYGGGGTLAALSMMSTARPSPLRAVVAYYPVCVGVRPWQVKVPVLIQIGSDDQQTPPDTCRKLDTQSASMPSTTISVYAKAQHGFDVPTFPSGAISPSGSKRQRTYNQRTAVMAWKAVEQFLQRHSSSL